MPKKIIGLEIGSNSLKIVSGFKRRGQFKLESAKVIKNSDKIFGLDGELNINEV